MKHGAQRSGVSRKWLQGRAGFLAPGYYSRTLAWVNRYPAIAKNSRLPFVEQRREVYLKLGRKAEADADELELAASAKDDELLAVDETLEQLASEDAELAKVVKLRFFRDTAAGTQGEVTR